MGRYIAWTDVANRYRSIPADGYDSGQLDAFIADAESEVDARLALKYAVPFDATTACPGLVRSLCIDTVFCRVAWAQDGTKKVQDRVDKLIKGILDGTILLSNSGGLLSGGNDVQASTSNAYRSVFGPDDPIFWSRSLSQTEDAQSERDGD